MKCPHCMHSIRFEEHDEFLYQLEGKPEEGHRLKYGFCPNCEEFIVLLEHGRYYEKAVGDRTYEGLTEPYEVEFLYPKTLAREPLPPEVTGQCRSDFEEAAAVLPISPKASAAISRRILQHMLQDHFNIKAGSLAAQIEAFITRADVPSHLSEAVDAVRNVGNLAAHPLKDQNTGMVVDVEPGEAEWLLDVLDSLFDFTLYNRRGWRSERKTSMKNLLPWESPR
jgi:hypothetical protein